MALQPVAGWRCGDSLPAELRSGVKEWQGSAFMPSLRLSAGQSGLSGMSIFRGATEGPSGYRAYNWPPYGYRGINGLGFNSSAYPASIEWDRNAGWSGLGFNSSAYPANGEWWTRHGWRNGWGGVAGLGDYVCPDYPDMSTCYDTGTTTTDTGSIPCMPDSSAGPLQAGQVYCDSRSTIPASGTTTTGAGGGGYTPPYATSTATLSTGQQVQTQHPPGWTGQTVCMPGSACPQAPNGYTWIPVITATGQMLAQIMAISQGGSYSTAPGRTAVSGTAGQPAAGTAASTAQQQQVGNIFSGTGGMMLLIGGAVLVMFMFSQSRK